MSVLELCDKDVASVRVEVSAADAIRLMLDRHVGAVASSIAQVWWRASLPSATCCASCRLTGRNPEVTPVRELMTTSG
jgi:hypothetical protein